MLLNDQQITARAEQGMITPFVPHLVRQVSQAIINELGKGTYGVTYEDRRMVSYGLSSFGYDLRLSPDDFRIFRHVPGTVVDPKSFSPDNLEAASLHEDESGQFFILPAHSYGLGVALERLEMPDDLTTICTGKSTYARCGIICNVTPAEAGWRGHLTLEFSNASSADCRIYANEGVCQLLFLQGEPTTVSYADRNGKYQDQPCQVILPLV